MSDQDKTTRRKFLYLSGGVGTMALAGCIGGGNGGDGNSGNGSSNSNSGNGNSGNGNSGGSNPGVLRAGGSSTVYPITSDGASVWNSNPPASDKEYWGPGQYNINTDKKLADYWAGLYGFDSPFQVTVGLSHSGTGVKKVKEGQIDIGDSSAPVSDELPDAKQSTLDNFVDHVVGVDGQPIVVSREIYDAGVKKITLEELKGIYKKNPKYTNWKQLGGPDKKIQAVGRAEGSGTDTAFRANALGDPEAAMREDLVRKGQNQQVQTLVKNSDNAIAYMALAFVKPEGQVPPIALEIDGTTYKYGKNLGAKEYPLSRDLHCYTWKNTSKKEAAFLNMLLSDFGQKNFVEPNNYFKLPEDRRKKQRDKLPDPSA